MKLPDTFLWGCATASFQVEGGYLEGGRGLTTHDFETDGSIDHPRRTTYILPDGTTGGARSSFLCRKICQTAQSLTSVTAVIIPAIRQ